MDIDNQDATETTTELKAKESDASDLSRNPKPEAPSIEAFLAEPTRYRPKAEFLGGVASYVEVLFEHIPRILQQASPE